MKKYYIYLILIVQLNLFSQNNLSLDLIYGQPLCSAGSCTSIEASFTEVKETNSYTVESIPFIPLFTYTGGTIAINPSTTDDYWSQLIDLPFNFCFYGNYYNQLMLGTNGVIHFPDGSQTASGSCSWSNNEILPSPLTPIKNAIYAVYQDTNASSSVVTNSSNQNVNYITLGSAPNRVFIINFSELPLFQCASSVGLQTTQVVLYETSNKINVFVKNRTACSSWNGGKGVLGIQNSAGTLATIPPGRNTGAWNATYEAWSFRPAGNLTSTIEWGVNGVAVPSANNLNVFNICPQDGDEVSAKVTYVNCQGQETILSESMVLNYDQVILGLGEPNNLSGCSADSEPVTFDLTQNHPVILNGLPPSDAIIRYFTTSNGAVNFLSPILNPESFNSLGQTIYVAVESQITGCFSFKQFDLVVNPTPQAPTGDSIQFFTQGQTLADLVVSGTNIKWYASATGNDLLSSNTALVHGVTYYASQTNLTTNCESKVSTPQRLAVTVQNVLGVNDFDFNTLKAYPNPVKDVLNLSYTKEISKVSIHNLVGQEVLSKSVNAMQSQVDLSRLAVGTYLVKVTVDGLENTIKVVKE